MGPLIPNGIIDAGWSYVVAVLLGFGFGFVLEASGFSSSRKIVGLFYGYDFTVLRVFFTATITAMVGLLYFNYMGWVDLSMIYFPPTFVKAAIIGGVIMGTGFIIGGFCPGTGLCGAAIGKIDGILFVIGLYIGIFAFSEAFPLVKDLYYGEGLGKIKIHETLGLSSGVFALLFIIAAITIFIISALIEKRVKKVDY